MHNLYIGMDKLSIQVQFYMLAVNNFSHAYTMGYLINKKNPSCYLCNLHVTVSE